MANQVFKLMYNFEAKHGVFSEDDIARADKGGCDAVVIIPIIRGEAGFRDQGIMTADGDNEGKNITPIELFKTWIALCGDLIRLEDLPDHLKEFVAMTFNQYTRHQMDIAAARSPKIWMPGQEGGGLPV